LTNDGESGYNPKSPETNPKNTQKQQRTENQRMLKPKYKLSGRSVFTFNLSGGQLAP